MSYLTHTRHLCANRIQRVVDLWNDPIDSNGGALQLLLIIDYIFDWARDIHRETIIAELRSFSASDSRSLAQDSDVFSLFDRLNTWISETDAVVDTQQREQDIVRDPFRYFVSPQGAIHDSRYIRSRFMSLYITEDTLSLLFQSTKTDEHAQSMVRKIPKFLKTVGV
jgi:hypothetical protein